MADLLSRYFYPRYFSSLLEEDEDWFDFSGSLRGGLSVSEDDRHVYVEANVAGIEPEKVDITYKKGVLWIKASKEETEEDKKKKFYRHSQQDYQYHISLPSSIDENIEPESTHKNGIVTIRFTKKAEEEPKKLTVKRE